MTITLRPEVFALATNPATIPDALQHAIKLEHATIPAYLYALYSLKPNTNTVIQKIILSIVVEEMLHLALACNLLNAIGGSPNIDRPGFIPTYPGPLPGGIESELTVTLAPFSTEQVKDVFMIIEEPEDPLRFPVKTALMAEVKPKTIGEFYSEIKEQLKGVSFGGDPSKQVTNGFFPGELIAITNYDLASTALETIIQQGEGTRRSPLDQDHDLAHYYRFAEIYYGKELIPTGTSPTNPQDDPGYIYGGDPIPFDPQGVWPVIKNPKASSYPPNTIARITNDTFNYTYTTLLKSLHTTFNGQPDQLDNAFTLMESLKEQAMALVEIDLGDGKNAGPSFEYRLVN
jgi:hypothetical protein